MLFDLSFLFKYSVHSLDFMYGVLFNSYNGPYIIETGTKACGLTLWLVLHVYLEICAL